MNAELWGFVIVGVLVCCAVLSEQRAHAKQRESEREHEAREAQKDLQARQLAQYEWLKRSGKRLNDRGYTPAVNHIAPAKRRGSQLRSVKA